MCAASAHLLTPFGVGQQLVHGKHRSDFICWRVGRPRVDFRREYFLQLLQFLLDGLFGEYLLDWPGELLLLEDEAETSFVASRHTAPQLSEQADFGVGGPFRLAL